MIFEIRIKNTHTHTHNDASGMVNVSLTVDARHMLAADQSGSEMNRQTEEAVGERP